MEEVTRPAPLKSTSQPSLTGFLGRLALRLGLAMLIFQACGAAWADELASFRLKIPEAYGRNDWNPRQSSLNDLVLSTPGICEGDVPINELENLAQKGSILAQRTLGIWKATGGLWYATKAPSAPINLQDSVRWFQIAADQGDAVAENGLGIAHLYGLGVSKDPVAASRLFAKSAEHGYLTGAVNAGLCLTFGPRSIADRERGLALLKAAADQGDFRAARNLYDTYLHGSVIGVSRNPLLATYWLHRAAGLAPPEEKVAARTLEILFLFAWFVAGLVLFLILKRILKTIA